MMRGWIIFAILLILTVPVFAQEDLCSDTDLGGEDSKDTSALTTKGSVKYGITTQKDTCLTSSGGVSTDEGVWLKEYYCVNDKRESEIYDCLKLGFSGCKDGACEGSSSGSSGTTTQQQAVPEEHCGNRILEKDKGEECDPPDKICFGKTTAQYGICEANCKCKIAGTAEPAEAVCGDDTLDSGEDCEKDEDCPEKFVCSSCKCVKTLTAEEIEAMKGGSSTTSKEKSDAAPVKNDVLADVDLTAKNFSDEPGVKAVSGFANFFKKIFAWIGDLFS